MSPKYREIAEAVRRHGGKQTAVARELGIANSTVSVAVLRARVEDLEAALQDIVDDTDDPRIRRVAQLALAAESGDREAPAE